MPSRVSARQDCKVIAAVVEVIKENLGDLQVRETTLFYIVLFAPIDNRRCVRIDVVCVGEIRNFDRRDLFDR